MIDESKEMPQAEVDAEIEAFSVAAAQMAIPLNGILGYVIVISGADGADRLVRWPPCSDECKTETMCARKEFEVARTIIDDALGDAGFSVRPVKTAQA